MAYRITLECGDKSVLRQKKTQDGFTHDWEVFVRGVDNAHIEHFIEKVVFNLHETFPKPKRVIKEPPYVVKESGYAGFDIPIHIYLKNKNEPKRFEIMYNLNLDLSVPSVNHIAHHSEIIMNPSDEFRRKLLKGGATPTSSTETVSEKNEVKNLPMIGKPKLSGNEGKKHRISEPKTSNQFSELFGTPIKTTKNPVENKKPSDKSSSNKTTVIPEKSDKSDKSTKIKHSPHKDSKKEKSSEEKKEKRDKEKDIKDKDKIKEKSKRSSSPKENKVSHHSSESKKPSSPSPIKRPTTPPSASKRPTSPSSKPKEVKKESEKEKEKLKEKEKTTSEESKTEKSEKSEKESKSERKKDKKKHKEDREKEKKDKHKDKDRERSRDKESSKSSDKKEKSDKSEKIEKEKLQEPKPPKEEKKSPKPNRENEKVKEEKVVKPEKLENNEKSEKKESKSEKSEKSEKSKHKHKKKDKKEKRDGSREREKKEKREKSKSSSEKHEVTNHSQVSNVPPPRVPEFRAERDSSESARSEDDDSNSEKKEPSVSPPKEAPRMSPPPAPVNDARKDKSEKKRDRSKSSREDKEKKKKRKSENKGDDEVPPKKSKDRDQSTSPLIEPVSSSQSPIATNLETLHASKNKHTEEPMIVDQAVNDGEQVAPDSTNSTLMEPEEPAVFSEDYVSQLKDLQQKIMTLQDNTELQRVVQMIAETGQYEITKKTFDFDLCTLDRRTVQRLQQFFAS